MLSIVGQILATILAYEAVRYVVVGKLRRRVHAQATAFVREHRIKLESARFIDRVWIREALAQDAQIDRAIARIGEDTGESGRSLRLRVDEYVDEIAPYFSLTAYYRFGATIARRFLDFCFEVDVHIGAFEAQAERVPKGAVKVYIINHRANMDPLILAYGLLHHVPMSYAVGEWALVWPLDRLFRAFGSYFVRRGEKDPLYHAVLERFIQLIAGNGAVTGFFIEGGLSRDGALRRPRTGLLDYIIKLRRTDPDREIVFLPVGLNYDRVFEDRILTRESDGPLPKPTALERAVNVAALIFWVPQLLVANLWRLAMRSHRKFGYAAVRFGEPLVLTDWPGGKDLADLPDEQRVVALDELAQELLYNRVGAVIPALPVPIFCTALLAEGPPDEAAIIIRVATVLQSLREVGVSLVLRGPEFDNFRAQRESDTPNGLDLDREEARLLVQLAALSLVTRRVLRRVISPTGEGYEVADGAGVLIRYYANSIAHHLAVPNG